MGWKKVCEVSDVPRGEMKNFSIGAFEVMVIHGDNGHLVVPPSCPHMENALADGFFDGCVLTCNKHLWQWSIPDAQPIGVAEQALLRYPSEIRDAAIWAEVETELQYCHEDECE